MAGFKPRRGWPPEPLAASYSAMELGPLGGGRTPTDGEASSCSSRREGRAATMPEGQCWSPHALFCRSSSGFTGTDEERELLAPLVRQPRNGSTGAGGAEPLHSREDSREAESPVEEEEVDLAHNGYTLVLMTGSVACLAMMLLVAAGQFGVLWLVAWSSPEYFFESGQWIVPISDYWSVNAMKGFALLLTLFRVSAEFKDATKMFRVLWEAEQLRAPLELQQRALGGGAFLLQYLVAVLVLFMAIHLILAATTPINTIGKLWVVYIVLDFDNQLCTFVLYVLNLPLNGKVVVLHRVADKTRHGRWMFCYWAPVLAGLAIAAASLLRNVCPLTGLHYGVVRNEDPVLMLTSNLALPGSCCPPQVAWDAELAGDPGAAANVSVPCLSPSKELPVVFYVVVPDGRPSPSSLQVMEGRGGDGNLGLRYGKVTAVPLQMHWWLSLHGFARLGVYDAMRNTEVGGVGLYSSNLPYAAQWAITDFPWDARVRIFAAAVNPATGALSPQPVQSAVILRKLCPAHCKQCGSRGGACWTCEQGFVLVRGLCMACASGCEVCRLVGPGGCDPGGCSAGYGLTSEGSACQPCVGGPLCKSCDALPANDTASFRELACRSCDAGYGLAGNGSCTPCETARCQLCPEELRSCEECLPGYVQWSTARNKTARQPREECLPCAAHCARCDHLGPGRCDPERCEAGYSLSPTGTCAPCSPQCLNCTKSGPGNCDRSQCKVGYGLQGPANAKCTKCGVDRCDVCDNGPDACDTCAEGFALTPEQTCEACADSCKRCTEVRDCAECNPRFGLADGKCLACADQCARCAAQGPGRCDEGHCLPGWSTRPAREGDSFTCFRNASAEVDDGSDAESRAE